jgi:hypothetical protein
MKITRPISGRCRKIPELITNADTNRQLGIFRNSEYRSIPLTEYCPFRAQTPSRTSWSRSLARALPLVRPPDDVACSSPVVQDSPDGINNRRQRRWRVSSRLHPFCFTSCMDKRLMMVVRNPAVVFHGPTSKLSLPDADPKHDNFQFGRCKSNLLTDKK